MKFLKKALLILSMLSAVCRKNFRGQCLLITRVETDEEDSFCRIWILDDMLGFASKIKRIGGYVFVVAGIEAVNGAGFECLRTLAKEIDRVTCAGDSVIAIDDKGVFPECMKNVGFIDLEGDKEDSERAFPLARVLIKK